MVCKGYNEDQSIQENCPTTHKTLQATGIFPDGMASNGFSRCQGRRKQTNPKKTNVDDDTDVDQQLRDDPPLEGRCGSPQQQSSLVADSIQNTIIQNTGTLVDPARTQDDPEISPTITQGSPAQPTETHTSNQGDNQRTNAMIPKDETANTPSDDQELAIPTTDMNPRTGEDDQCVTMVTEEEKIQELMSRSDTAVIYPEPVSDQEEGATTTENDEPAELDDCTARCPHCDDTFSDVELLKEHWHGSHSLSVSPSKHLCPQCGIHFPAKSQLEKHVLLHSPASQVCKICNKTFANVYRLQRHMISHEESSELRKFKCPECGKAFKFKHHLKEHIRIHSGEKPFECQNCGKRFSHSGSYSSHMTSKKCWIVNLKMRGGNMTRSPEKSDKNSRPLVPKALDNGMDLGLASMMYGSGMIPPQQFPMFDQAAAAQMQSQFLAQLKNSGQTGPFLPPLPFPGMTNHSMLPTLANLEAFSCLTPGGVLDKDAAVMGSLSETATMHTDVKQEKMDENQNKEICPKVEVKDTANTGNTSDSDTKNDMEAITKVLEIVGATVKHQIHDKEEKVASDPVKVEDPDDKSRTLTALASAATQQLQQLMKETKTDEPCDTQPDTTTPVKASTAMPCKFCKLSFTSPIMLHQHERYLCKQNHEIAGLDSEPTSSGLTSPAASSHDDPLGDDHQENERKIRVRSMITDEQVQVLKTFYHKNQRPNKYELESLAHQIGFPKRVVQVWFQNMRARDRRKGRTFQPSSTDGSSTSITTTSYIPKVPQVAMPTAMSSPMYYGSTASPSLPKGGIYGSSSSPQRASEASVSADQPLDLTVRRPEAHTNKPFSSKPNPDDVSGEVLNLSIKSDMGEESHEMERANTKDGSPAPGAMAPTSPAIMSVPLSVPLQINTTPAHSRSYSSLTSVQGTPFPQVSTQPLPAHTTVHNLYDPSTGTSSPGPLHQDTHHTDTLRPDPGLSPLTVSLDNSFTNSSLEGSELSASPYSINKPKRARKKSWRQVGGNVESEEYPDLDLESVDEDGDSLMSRKKRRSWKQHRVDVAEGLYACDQCDKMFSKQSSLARHKYEHSGQRPFPCDICTKAFKHKHHLTEHKRLHSGEKPFQCQKCGKRFSHSGSYSQHMNHRYKYCKPLRGTDSDSIDADLDNMDHSEDTSP